MDIEELKAMIPSETVRRYVLDTRWTFTDMQKAALLYHSSLPLEQRYSWLRALRDKAGDEALREQITEYLSCKEQGLQAFKENKDRSHIYVLRVGADDEDQYDRLQPEGYFFDWELAYGCGKQREQPFQIEKYVVHDASKPSDDNDSSVADLRFNKDGGASYFWSREVPFNEEEDDCFTCIFYEAPNPFERGDIVRLVGTEDYGVVETTQKRWKDNLVRWKSPEWQQESRFHYVDYSDVQVRVVFPGEDGTFGHAHINPVNLELYHPQSSRTDRSPIDQLLLCASDLYKGEGSFDELSYSIAEYRKSTRGLS